LRLGSDEPWQFCGIVADHFLGVDQALPVLADQSGQIFNHVVVVVVLVAAVGAAVLVVAAPDLGLGVGPLRPGLLPVVVVVLVVRKRIRKVVLLVLGLRSRVVHQHETIIFY
jgi:hypothetical protein